ncbi:MAG: SMC family ATPase, partial [Acidimicrobiales bacterium]|nr:SMC family ATPase [Acidimicrobiales bacterium]
MRPIRLEVQGFAAFREPVVVDLADADLVALVGPTGSGKSSLIDAITFALYGSVPRYGDVRLVAPVINQLSNEARVRLDFEIAGRLHTAVRVVRRTKNGASTREARLERGDDVLAGSAREMGPAVEAVVGLTFEQFCRTVVLPQGEFAQFLHDDPARRQDLLVRLLDLGMYEAMAARARRRAAANAERLALLDEQIAGSADVSEAALAEAQATAVRLERSVGAVAELADALARHDAELARRTEERDRAHERAEALATVAPPEDAVRLGVDLDAAARAEIAAGERLDRARRRLGAARAAVEDGPALAELERLIGARERAAEVEQERARHAPLAEAAASGAAAAAEDERVTSEAVDAAEADVRAARRAADAASWVAVLREGEECPVCRQVVHQLPDHDASTELARAEERLEGCQAALKRASTARAKADRAAVGHRARLEALELELAQVEALIGDAPAGDVLRGMVDRARLAAEEEGAARADVDAADSD